MEKLISAEAQILAERLDEVMSDLGLSKEGLGLELFEKKDVIRDVRRKGAIPNEMRLHKIAARLGVSVDWLRGRTDNKLAREATVAEISMDFRGKRPDYDLPVLGTAHGGTCKFGENGELVTVERTIFEPSSVVRFIHRPLALIGAKQAYAVYHQGDSMMPVFGPGDLSVVDPRRPPQIGDDVIVQLMSEADTESEIDGEIVSVLVKRLVRRSGTFVELEQFNPACTFRVETNRIAALHRIVPMADMLGA